MKQIPITAVVLAKNEAEMIKHCLDTLQWCQQILVIDTGSTDDTAKLAEKNGAQVISFKHHSFARLRTEALKHTDTEWLLYIDADERVTPELAKEIAVNIETANYSALTFRRENYFFGEKLEHGGWDCDTVTRAFKKADLEEWYGDIHESPKFSGAEKELSFPLIHFSHRNVADGLLKSAAWTPIEARLLHEAGESPVTVRRVLKKMVAEFVRRAFLKKGHQDGQTGMMEALIQGINRALVYIQVWELQQDPPIKKKYDKLEKQLTQKWRSA